MKTLVRLPLTTTALALAALLVFGCLASMSSGALSLPLWDSLLAVLDNILGSSRSSLAAHEQAVVWELRLPRTLLAVLVGAMLAQCGAAMQGLFRNPLADPGIIGVSSGAAVGAVLAIYFSPVAASWWTVPLSAFAAGFACSLLIYRLARASLGTSVLVLLLAGIAISALAGSLIGLISYVADDSRLRDLTLWQMGSLAAADSTRVWLALVVAVAIAWRFQYRAAALNALLLGEAEARHLGIHVESLKRELILLVALGVGLSVACAGVIGFVGLVVPHMVRTLSGPDHRSLLPLAGLGGALLLLLADIVSRLVIQPAELPVGMVTALLGAPFFIVLLLQQKERG
ncbi:MAG: iron ABC transporter permease [Halieaceae bacterium]|nr:iron ABC transporter permease [Halieaceae bacterium]